MEASLIVKKSSILAVAALVAAVSGPVRAQQPPALTLPRPSQKGTVEQRIGIADVKISYSRPGVKGRVIWGELVPFDKVWRTGANEASTISFSADVKVNGQPLPAGTYSLHTIPTAGDWTVIFNRKAEQWGSYSYDEKEDALRIKVTPAAHEMTEWMTFSFPVIAVDKATVALDWEKVRVPFELQFDTVSQCLAACRKAMADLKADDNSTAYRCAAFAFDNSVALDEAAGWLDRAISIKPTWLAHRLKANMLAKKGDTAGAIEQATRAITVGKTDEAPPDELTKLEKMIADWKAGKK